MHKYFFYWFSSKVPVTHHIELRCVKPTHLYRLWKVGFPSYANTWVPRNVLLGYLRKSVSSAIKSVSENE